MIQPTHKPKKNAKTQKVKISKANACLLSESVKAAGGPSPAPLLFLERFLLLSLFFYCPPVSTALFCRCLLSSSRFCFRRSLTHALCAYVMTCPRQRRSWLEAGGERVGGAPCRGASGSQPRLGTPFPSSLFPSSSSSFSSFFLFNFLCFPSRGNKNSQYSSRTE